MHVHAAWVGLVTVVVEEEEEEQIGTEPAHCVAVPLQPQA